MLCGWCVKPFSVSVFHCRRVVCACSAGAVGSFSNKPLSQKKSLSLCLDCKTVYSKIKEEFVADELSLRMRGLEL